jgi:hypothetical protein
MPAAKARLRTVEQAQPSDTRLFYWRPGPLATRAALRREAARCAKLAKWATEMGWANVAARWQGRADGLRAALK